MKDNLDPSPEMATKLENNQPQENLGPIRNGYVEDVWIVIRDHASSLAVMVAIAYATGWFAQIVAMDSLKVGEITPAREKSIISGILILFILWPILTAGILVRWRRRRNLARLDFVFAILTLIFHLSMFTLTVREEAFFSLRSYLFAGCYVGFGAMMAKDTYQSKKVFVTANGYLIACLWIILSYHFAFIVKPQFGGLRSDPVTVRLNDGKSLECIEVAEDRNWIVVKDLPASGRYQKIAKGEVAEISNQIQPAGQPERKQ